jgi:hypothetical protein
MKTAPFGAVPGLVPGCRDLCPSLDASLIYEVGLVTLGRRSLVT